MFSNRNPEDDFYFEQSKMLKATGKCDQNSINFSNLPKSFYKIQFVLRKLKRDHQLSQEIIRNISFIKTLFYCDDRDIRKKAFQIALLLEDIHKQDLANGRISRNCLDYYEEIVSYRDKFLSFGPFEPWFASREGVCEFMLDSEVFRDLQTLKLAVKLVIKCGYGFEIVPVADDIPQFIIDLYSDHDSDLVVVLGLLADSTDLSLGMKANGESIIVSGLNAVFVMFIKFMDLIGFDESVLVDMIMADNDDGTRLTIEYLSKVLKSISGNADAFDSVCMEIFSGVECMEAGLGDGDGLDEDDANTDTFESIRLTLLQVDHLLSSGSVLAPSDPFLAILRSIPSRN